METKLKTLLLQCYQLSLIDEKLQPGITDDTISANLGKSLKNQIAKLQKNHKLATLINAANSCTHDLSSK